MTSDPQPALLELVYSSATPIPINTDGVRQLLDHARRSNAQTHVTGLLCYDHKQFLQIIEGETDVIMDLFHKIQSDPRHTDVCILHEGDIQTRAFSDWKMAYEPVPSGLLPTLTRAIHARSIGDMTQGGLSAGRRIFTLFMDDMYGEPINALESEDA